MKIDKTANVTSRVWGVFSNVNGVILDATTANVTIYPANSDTPTINNGTMTRLGTGIYYYPFDTTSVNNGVYTAHYNFVSDGTNFDNVEPIFINTGLTDGDFNKAFGSMGRIYSNFSESVGQEADAGTVLISVFPANGTEIIYNALMTRLGTGLYHYPLNYGTFTKGNYTALFTALKGTNNYSGVYPFTVNDGTADTGAVPSQVGTFNVVNNGTENIIQFIPSGADGYNVYRSENMTNNFEFLTSGVAGTYTDTTAVSGRDYWYYVIGTSAVGGASLPSTFKNVLTGTNIDYMTNIMTTLKNTFTSNIPEITAIHYGAEEVIPYQYPFMSIIPQNRDDEPITVGYSGQYDKIFNFILRTYTGVSSGAGAVGTALSILSEVESKVSMELEALKTNNPYWYTSDITAVEYGEAVIDEIKLKYIDLNWMAKKRINR